MTLFRESHQRRTILEYLENHRTHPRAAEIHAALKKKIKTLSLGTVYRNLEILKRQGKVRSLGLGQPEARYDIACRPHGHFICSECGAVMDLELKTGCCQLTSQLDAAGYHIQSTNVEMIGLCPNCKSHQ